MQTVLYQFKFELKNFLLCLIPLFVALIIVLINIKKFKTLHKLQLIMGGVLCLALLTISVVLCVNKISSYIELKNYLNSSDCLSVQGEVENFHQMPSTGHDLEHFEIDGVYFAYSDYEIVNGYHNASSKGGVITHDGQKLFIKYYFDSNTKRNVILYIEEMIE